MRVDVRAALLLGSSPKFGTLKGSCFSILSSAKAIISYWESMIFTGSLQEGGDLFRLWLYGSLPFQTFDERPSAEEENELKYSLVYSFFARKMIGYVHRSTTQNFFIAASEHLGPKLNLNPAWFKDFLNKVYERKLRATKQLLHLLRGTIQIYQDNTLMKWHLDAVPAGGWRGELAVWDKVNSLSLLRSNMGSVSKVLTEGDSLYFKGHRVYVEALRSLRALFGRISVEESFLRIPLVDPDLPSLGNEDDVSEILDLEIGIENLHYEVWDDNSENYSESGNIAR